MIQPFIPDRLVTMNLAYQAVNDDYLRIAEQICIITDTFEKKINNFTPNQLLFLKACLSLQEALEQKPASSLIHYQLFLIEERLKNKR